MTSFPLWVLRYLSWVLLLAFLNSAVANTTIPGSPLSIVLIDSLGGRHQVKYSNVRQVYPNTDVAGDSGISIFFNGTSYGFRGNATSGTVGANQLSIASQTVLLGTGSLADPWRVETVFDAGTSLSIKQTVYYQNGDNFALFKWDILSTTNYTGVKFFHGTDNYNNQQDNGYGAFNASCGSISVGSPQTGTNFYQEFIPVTAISAYQEGLYYNIWNAVRAGALNSSVDSSWHDATTAIQWNFDLQAGVSKSIYQKWSFGTSPCSSSATLPPYLATDLSISKTVDTREVAIINDADSSKNVTPGDTIRFNINVSNLGSITANALTVTDILPAGYSYVASSIAGGNARNDANPSTTGLIWTITNLNAGDSVSLSFHAVVNELATPSFYQNTATLSSSTPDSNLSNNSSSTTPDVLRITKFICNESLQGDSSCDLADFAFSVGGSPGDILVYRIEYENFATEILNFDFSDDVPFYTSLLENSYTPLGEALVECHANGSSSSVSLDLGTVATISSNLTSASACNGSILPGESGAVLFKAMIN